MSSPLPFVTEKSSGLSLYLALRHVEQGERITKLEWNDPSIYGVLHAGRLRIHLKDGLLHDWIISDGDLVGTDWVVVNP